MKSLIITALLAMSLFGSYAMRTVASSVPLDRPSVQFCTDPETGLFVVCKHMWEV